MENHCRSDLQCRAEAQDGCYGIAPWIERDYSQRSLSTSQEDEVSLHGHYTNDIGQTCPLSAWRIPPPSLFKTSKGNYRVTFQFALEARTQLSGPFLQKVSGYYP